MPYSYFGSQLNGYRHWRKDTCPMDELALGWKRGTVQGNADTLKRPTADWRKWNCRQISLPVFYRQYSFACFSICLTLQNKIACRNCNLNSCWEQNKQRGVVINFVKLSEQICFSSLERNRLRNGLNAISTLLPSFLFQSLPSPHSK